MRIEMDGHEIVVTHPERVVYPQDGYTKGDVVSYYRDVAPVMVPHLAGRPLTLHRFPRGAGAQGFYQKNSPGSVPSFARRVTVGKAGGSVRMLVCDNAATLVWVAHQNAITLHVWTSRIELEFRADVLVVDLDPADGMPFAVVRETALLLRSLLDEYALPSFVKTTGSRGLHVAVPLDGSDAPSAVGAFAGRIASELVARDPDRLTTEFSKEDRGGRLYVDVGRNAPAQTFAAAYTLRAIRGAPVSAPLGWDEVQDPSLDPRGFTLANVRDRLAARGDPWASLYASGAVLP